jgi:LPXTG-motif cell wall-anchored protein
MNLRVIRLFAAVLTLCVAMLATGAAAAYADSASYTSPNVTVTQEPPKSGPVGPGEPASSTTSEPGGGLPFTGGDIAAMSLVGLGAVAAGTALVVRSRRRRSSTQPLAG